jgi:predicted N-acetyltransferase YhbS
LIIRQEQPIDYPEVYELVKMSFTASSQSDGTEADYLNDVRKKDAFIPELSLVAENDRGEIIGQIVLYKTEVTVTDEATATDEVSAIDEVTATSEVTVTAEVTATSEVITELVLSPLCVHPDYFRRGIARALMEKAFIIAKSLGYSAVFLCGDPEFYRKVGFRPSYEHGIFHITDTSRNAEWCMVRELTEGVLRGMCGTVDIL